MVYPIIYMVYPIIYMVYPIIYMVSTILLVVYRISLAHPQYFIIDHEFTSWKVSDIMASFRGGE